MSKLFLALVAAVGLTAACSDSPTEAVNEPPPAVVDTIEIVGANVDLAPGDSVQLVARARDANGQIVDGQTFTWSTDDPGVATVNADGLVTAIAAGEVVVAADTAEVSGGVILVVTDLAPAAVDHVTLDYLEISLPVGDTLQLVATPRDAQGAPLAREVTWSSNNADYVAVSATGLVTALEVAGADITATSEGKSASVRVYATGTTGHILTALGGQALPSLLGSYSEPAPDGGTYTSTVRVFDGWMLIDHTSRTYEVVVSATVTTARQPASLPFIVQYESQGSISLDPATGVYTFQPMIGDAFTGQWVTGAMQVRWQPEPRIAGASTFLFTND